MFTKCCIYIYIPPIRGEDYISHVLSTLFQVPFTLFAVPCIECVIRIVPSLTCTMLSCCRLEGRRFLRLLHQCREEVREEDDNLVYLDPNQLVEEADKNSIRTEYTVTAV